MSAKSRSLPHPLQVATIRPAPSAAQLQAALAELESGQDAGARELLRTSRLGRERLLLALAEHETRRAYRQAGLEPDPAHPEHRLIVERVRAELARDPESSPASSFPGRLPAEAYDPALGEPGPLAARALASLRVITPAILPALTREQAEALRRYREGPLVERFCELVCDVALRQLRRAYLIFGVDDGCYRLVSTASDGTPHILEKDAPGALCGARVAVNGYARLLRTRRARRFAEIPGACRRCTELARPEHEDLRPGRHPLGSPEHKERVLARLRTRWPVAQRDLRRIPDESIHKWALERLLGMGSPPEGPADFLAAVFADQLRVRLAEARPTVGESELTLPRLASARLDRLLSPEQLRFISRRFLGAFRLGDLARAAEREIRKSAGELS